MLCGSRSAVVAAAAKTAPPESLRQSEFGARLNPATTKVLCPTARANRREVLRRFAFISLLASVWTPCMQTILLPFSAQI